MNKQAQQPSKKELRNFGLVTGAITVFLFGLLLPWLFNHKFPLWPWIIAGVLFTWAILLPKSLHPVYKGWLTIGNVLGWINSRIILGFMFYIMFLPVGLVMRIFGRDPMSRNMDKSKSSYRIISSVPKKDHFERPY